LNLDLKYQRHYHVAEWFSKPEYISNSNQLFYSKNVEPDIDHIAFKILSFIFFEKNNFSLIKIENYSNRILDILLSLFDLYSLFYFILFFILFYFICFRFFWTMECYFNKFIFFNFILLFFIYFVFNFSFFVVQSSHYTKFFSWFFSFVYFSI
jgi:hypothetical protein